jgi:hypothetical protein
MANDMPPPATKQGRVAAKRRCLSCRRPFQSCWAGHRICTRCKRLDAWSAPVTDYSIRF